MIGDQSQHSVSITFWGSDAVLKLSKCTVGSIIAVK